MQMTRFEPRISGSLRHNDCPNVVTVYLTLIMQSPENVQAGKINEINFIDWSMHPSRLAKNIEISINQIKQIAQREIQSE